jgi:PAS domain-containing protein
MERKRDRRNLRIGGLSTEELQKYLDDMEAQLLQLEMEYEELRRAQELVEESRSSYSDLYDYAPVGYSTFDGRGRIFDMSIRASEMLSRSRESLRNQHVLPFIDRQTRGAFLRQ